MESKLSRNTLRKKRHLRVRKNLRGTAARPRVSVFKSLKNISLQLIDDTAGRTICAVSTLRKDFEGKSTRSIAAAEQLGQAFAEKIKQSTVDAVVFDRGGYKYHGKVKAVAEALRKAGIKL